MTDSAFTADLGHAGMMQRLTGPLRAIVMAGPMVKAVRAAITAS